MKRQAGSVIIIVLWTAVLLTVLVTAMASKVRLSAQTVIHNQEASMSWATLMGAVNQTEMELMLDRMPRPIDEDLQRTADGATRTPAYRFNGQPAELHYPLGENITVRIFDHAGKINLNRIPRRNMQLLIEKRLGGQQADPEEVQDLLTAWTDWTDLNDLEGLNGAERDYYESLEQPYTPRNNPELDTVEEILHIRGFAELFEGVNLEAAFTIYGNTRTVNLNLATREAMELLPGLDEELIENILAYRELDELNNRAEIAEIVPFEELQELSPWVGNNTSNFYSVFVYENIEVDEETLQTLAEKEFPNLDLVQQAYMEIVEVRGFSELPNIHRIDPYGRLPDTGPPRVYEEDYLFDIPSGFSVD
ncbi:MAG: type II secretion system protein GspK [Gammaproteobacteria bacterium]|nr:type II secretion system protein GspK [Gammaproteobacteria bacterium]MDD9897174.1 type II secretion system protein GspK [Gammaproteobacteria bacterium]MDD9958103.1 type II secretion system protein GspK [Gammaproteobacteria bacterium]